jgi:hypothetical protein
MKRTIAALLTVCLALSVVPALAGQPFAPENDLERMRQALYCFLDSAFSAEYGDKSRNFMIRWKKDITVSVEGDYTAQDRDTVDTYIAGLNSMVANLPTISISSNPDKALINIIFSPLDQMSDYLSSYVEGNWGYFSYWYDGSGAITKAVILIATDVTDQSSRNHLILEEITGALGLVNDIYTYSDSILYAPWTETQELSDLDWLMLNDLYSKLVKPKMTAPEAYKALLQTLN